MPCYYHPQREAIGTCPVCEKQLCSDCFDLTVGHYCYDCAVNETIGLKKLFMKNLIVSILTILCFIVGGILFTLDSIGDAKYIGLALMVVGGFYPAWKFLGALANRVLGARVYYGFMIALAIIIKFVLSVFVSFFVPIVYLVKTIIALVNYSKQNKNLKVLNELHHKNLSNE